MIKTESSCDSFMLVGEEKNKFRYLHVDLGTVESHKENMESRKGYIHERMEKVMRKQW